MENLVKNNSKGYGYNYASLGDIAVQGFKLPKMKTGSEGERDYVFYFDDEIKEWIRGAEIVVPEAKGMNKAQIYGSALTYARRYTTLMALQLACGDDKLIESLKEDGTKKPEITEEKVEDLRAEMFPQEIQLSLKQINWIQEQKGYKDLNQVTEEDKKWFVNLMKEKKGK